MEIAVLGAGAMGCLFGAGLFARGHRVVLVDVAVDHVRAIEERGLIVETEDGPRTVPIAARLPEEVQDPPELLLLFTKAFHTSAALAGARHLLGERTWILTLQNGLGHVEAIEPYLERSRILVGMTTFPSDLAGPGRIRTHGVGVTRITTADGTPHPFAEAVAKTLDEAGFRCEASPDAWTSIWEKVAFNAAVNPLTAVTGLAVDRVGDAPDGRELARRVVAEVAEVAHRKGIPVDAAAVEKTLEKVYREHRGHRPSMCQDVLARRPTEIEFINGAVVREARALGIPVPVTEALCRLVRTLEHDYLRPAS